MAVVVRVEVPEADVEVASDLLWQAGATAVGEAADAEGTVTLTAELETVPPELERRGWQVREHVDDGDWQDGWRPYARAVPAGPFFVRPPWVDAEVPPGARELVLDGGRAFGTGSHPSTVLALELLAPLVRPDTAVLDIGCGSGALAIGAALLGAAPVVAIDVDPAAFEATTRNAAANGVAGAVEVLHGDAADLAAGRGFDLVVANVGAPLVEELAPAIRRLLVPGGAIVLSGMLAGREAAVPRHYPDATVLAIASLDGWTAIALRDLSGTSPARPRASGPTPAGAA